jgi:hypothetical protein
MVAPSVPLTRFQFFLPCSHHTIGFDPYPDVSAPTDETNIACDIGAANFVQDMTVSPFDRIVYVPVEMADEIGGDDYIKIVQAGESGANLGAKATIDFYRSWSAAGRADENLLIHLEALAYDPETESTPQFDPCAIMVAMQLLDDDSCEDRASIIDVPGGVKFLEAGKGASFPDSPRSGFSLLPEGFDVAMLPMECPALTPYRFDPSATEAKEMPVSIAFGYTSPEAKASFYAEMASRMAGETITCVKKGK